MGLLENPPDGVLNGRTSPPQQQGSSAAAAEGITTPRLTGASAGEARVQVKLEDGWYDSPENEVRQILDNLSRGQSKFSIVSQRGMYIIDLTGPSGPMQLNPATQRSRPLRIREVQRATTTTMTRAPFEPEASVDELQSPKSPERQQELKRQKRFGAQSRRGKASQLQLEILKNFPHGIACFQELFKNEEKYSGEWAVFYHSYSFAAVIYEVHAAVANVLFGFPSHRSPLPRLLVSEFARTPDAASLVKRFDTEFVARSKDHMPEYRKVAISVMCSLVALGPEASTPCIFMHGYSEKDVSFSGVLENLLESCLVPKANVQKVASSVISLGEKYGLDVAQFGGGGCQSGKPGHLLQIFVKRRLVDDLAYAAHPYGGLDEERHPISAWLNGDNSTAFGQARVVANPKSFLSDRCVRMHVASADPQFHSSRQRFQQDLVKLLNGVFGDGASKERIATRIYGGALPDWWRGDMVHR